MHGHFHAQRGLAFASFMATAIGSVEGKFLHFCFAHHEVQHVLAFSQLFQIFKTNSSVCLVFDELKNEARLSSVIALSAVRWV